MDDQDALSIRQDVLAALQRLLSRGDASELEVETIMVTLRRGDEREVVLVEPGEGGQVAMKTTLGGARPNQEAQSQIPREAPSMVTSNLTVPPAPPPEAARDQAELAAWLQSTIVAVLRAGLERARESPTVLDALSQAPEISAKTGQSWAWARWVGRLRNALDGADHLLALLLLVGAADVLSDLQQAKPTALAKLWLGRWIELGEHTTRYNDRVLVEVARERVDGWRRQQLERRYLADPNHGEVFSEWGTRSENVLSLGPCPRMLRVALASKHTLPTPTWLRIHQYTVSPFLETETWERLMAHSHTRSDNIVERFIEANRRVPGLSEPFIMFNVETYQDDNPLAPMGRDRQVLPLLCQGPERSEALRLLWSKSRPVWIAGRVTLRNGRLAMLPEAALRSEDGRLHFERLS